ncbi:MAG: 5-formyltetrahydrofolate cyclo-ligase [Gammaproteobacteria bacterium]|nr:5-formyltetrahydrofolate cyclo-ligase [Gammaproteobacteria bacterium]
MTAPTQTDKSAGPLPVSDLRKELRARRRSLSVARRLANSEAATDHLIRSGIFLRYRSIAVYQACDGELDPAPLAGIGFRFGKKLYLPVLRHDGKQALWFVEYRPDDVMQKNRFGIGEPMGVKRRCIAPWALDLILVPLVGFDQLGNRMGMGGGYYDRTLAFLKHREHWYRPKLIGMAHECQRLSNMNVRSWDVPLDGVVTEAGLHLRVKKTI